MDASSIGLFETGPWHIALLAVHTLVLILAARVLSQRAAAEAPSLSLPVRTRGAAPVARLSDGIDRHAFGDASNHAASESHKPPAGRAAFSSSELSFARGLFDHFGGKRDGYEPVFELTDLRFLRRRLSARASAYVTEGALDCSVDTFLALWVDGAFRREWDSGLARLEELECGGVVHAVKFPYPLRPRVYLYDRAVVRPEAAGQPTVLLAKSAAARLAHAVSGCDGVVCPTFEAYTAVRPAAGGGAGAGPRCEFVIWSLDEQAVPIPGWLIASLMSRSYPAYMKCAREAALAREAASCPTRDASVEPSPAPSVLAAPMAARPHHTPTDQSHVTPAPYPAPPARRQLAERGAAAAPPPPPARKKPPPCEADADAGTARRRLRPQSPRGGMPAALAVI